MIDRILITGGAGFIGSHLTEKLLTHGNHIISIDNFDPYYSIKYKQVNIEKFLKNKNYKFYLGDIRNNQKLDQIFKKEKPDIVIHLAAKVGVRESLIKSREFAETNIGGTENILQLSKNLKIKKLIFTSSSSVYGSNKSLPFSENQKTTSQISPYARTKKQGELLCHKYHDLFGLSVVILRLFTVYGPSGRPDMLPYRLIESIYHRKAFNKFGKGDSERNYTYINDVINGILKVIKKDYPFEIFNLASGISISLNNFIKMTEDLIGIKANINSLPDQIGDISIVRADITKAKRMLNYNPQTNLKSGILNLIQWFKRKRLFDKK